MKRFGNFWLLLFVVFSAVVVFATLAVTMRQAQELGREERAKIALWAEATKRMANLENVNQDFTFILKVILRNDNVPVILTNEDATPISIRNVPHAEGMDMSELQQLMHQYSLEHEPIRIALPSGGVNFVYYGSSSILQQLTYYPYIWLLMIGVLVLLGYLVLQRSRVAEQNRVWVGLAKETAHQLGTPISSLGAWHQLLEEEEAMPEFTESLGMDVQRLQRVAERFSKIGAVAQLSDTDLWRTLNESILYMSPRISQRIELTLVLPGHRETIEHNAILLQWVLENLIRNAVDAIQGNGRINITLKYSGSYALIDVADTGQGIPRHKRRSVFRPGYSTKKRGWGLGLSLARRIVREYHHGKIFVLQSEVGRGTTVRIALRRRGDS